MAESDNSCAPDIAEQVVPGSVQEETHAIDATDDFDPFGEQEFSEETVECSQSAPPESLWYNGKLDRTTAEERLKNVEAGSYLVRESDRRPGSFVLSFVGKGGINHFRITAMCGDYYIGGREFDTLSDLIGYYTSHADLLKNERLIYPVPPPEPVNDRRRVIALLPYQKMPDTDELSFQKGEVFFVHNDMGDGWLWVTSQSTNHSGIINQELVKEYNNEDSVEMEEWFFADITKEEAAQKLAAAGVGSWLVRRSDNTIGDYTLFFFVNNHIERFRIQRLIGTQQFTMGGRNFDSVSAIIQRYRHEQIVEGATLGTAVLKPKLLAVSDAVDGIYAAVKQSNGSNFFLNRKDTIVLKGYLNKKSQKTKKWKSMYFVLNDTEQQLYYFENQKRSKPKGLIDLSYSSLYPVDESLFGRPNCFQIIMRALNTVSVYYMCAENSDRAQEWLQALKPYCLNTKPRRSNNLTDVPTEVRSLYIKIFEAKRLPLKQLPHPYCLVALNDMKLCRTQAKDSPDPCWDEEFLIDDIPPDITTFSVSFYNKTKRSKDVEVMNMKKTLDTVRPDFEEDWHSLWPAGNMTTKTSELPSVRIRTRFRVEIILPSGQYTSLKELLLSNVDVLFALAGVCDSNKTNNDRTLLATALLNIFRHERQEAVLLRTANDREIDREEDSCTLFRSVSFATTLMDQYMRMLCSEFVSQAVGGVINKIVDSKQSCDSVDGGMSDQQNLNLVYITSLMDEILDSIIMAIDTCPIVLRHICGCLQKKVTAKWPTEPLTRTRAISGFIFLRLLCLAIFNPKQFNLVTEAPSQQAARTLKVVANTLIKLANLTEYKEPVMEQLNGFIRDRHQQLVEFLDRLSAVMEVPAQSERPSIDLSRSLAIVHQLCQTHIDELKKISQIKPDTKKLVAITETLTTHEKLFMMPS